jgi:hypothetical protein
VQGFGRIDLLNGTYFAGDDSLLYVRDWQGLRHQMMDVLKFTITDGYMDEGQRGFMVGP